MESDSSILAQVRDPGIWMPALVCFVGLASYQYYKRAQNFWVHRKIKGERQLSTLGEIIDRVFLREPYRYAVNLTKEYGKLHGTFVLGKPKLVVADPEIIRQICIKDFDAFQDHSRRDWAHKYEKHFLFWIQGEHWRRVRAMMSPQFTSGRIKRMFKLLDGCSDDLVEHLRELMISARRDHRRLAEIDLIDVFGSYTMNGITTCAYGLRLHRERSKLGRLKGAAGRDSLERDVDRFFGFDLSRIFMMTLLPKSLLKAIGFTSRPESRIKPVLERVEKLLEMRRQGLVSRQDDLLQMLAEANSDEQLELNELDDAENHHAGLSRESLLNDQERLKSSLERPKAQSQTNNGDSEAPGPAPAPMGLSEMEILSHAMLMMHVGHETTRTLLSTATYLLAHNPQIQDRLFKELSAIAVKEDTPVGTRTTFEYDSLTSCRYLDAVISESLRFFGPVVYTDRVASRDYKIEKYDVVIPKGESIFMGIHSVQNDPDYWSEPDRFDPERFMPEHKDKIVPGSYMPFGIGPRHCIGMRFSLTEAKLGLAKAIVGYEFRPAPGTKYPPMGSFSLGVIKVKDCRVLMEYRDEAGS